MPSRTAGAFASQSRYGIYLLFICGMGGLLYGVDIGIIAAALLYVSRSISLTVGQTSAIVAAVLGGSMVSSLLTGLLADWIGRRRTLIFGGLLFVTSVLLIVASQGFLTLLTGRLLQGASGGIIAVVVPLYLAECLGPEVRGRGTALFQLMLTVGIVLAAAAGWFYTGRAETAIAAAAGNETLIQVAQNHAWRAMFLSVLYPGVIFFVGCFFLSESPRWLFQKGERERALVAMRRTSSPADVDRQMAEMEARAADQGPQSSHHGSLLQRRYVVPFILACVVLTCTQATGINSVLSYLVLILKQAGMSARSSTSGDLIVKLLNCLMTIVAVLLVDRKGRKFLLSLGTGLLVVALTSTSLLFYSFESKRVDIRSTLQDRVQGNSLHLSDPIPTNAGQQHRNLTVLYSYGQGQKMAGVRSGDPAAVLAIEPEAAEAHGNLLIQHAYLTPQPSRGTTFALAASLALFIMAFSVGPGVVTWLVLSELMPTRIRSSGMGIALVLNQAASTALAALFLPVVGSHGYFAMFAFWAACTVIYFITAVRFLPETKGKTLEEIEVFFQSPKTHSARA